MIKRLKIWLMMILLLPMEASAEKVSEQEALQIAQAFMKDKTFTLPSLSRGMGGAASTADTRHYYVFNATSGGGFVIVSDDDRAPAVLGYSDKGSFDVEHVPENLQWLMDYYEKSIGSFTMDGRPVRRTPSRLSSDRTSIAPLVETQWNQESPYNDQCPVYKGSRCVTGCVATAWAQLLNYHKWPVKATTAIPAYMTSKYRISMPELPPATFSWDAMTDDDIARLMLYCGQAIEMDYGHNSSGADIFGTPFVTYFDYDRNMKTAVRSYYSEEAWTNILYQELKEKRPVMYKGGGKKNNGHAIICDGYDANNDMFHLNFGWGGEHDGYYILSFIYTGYYDFSDSQYAIIGIQPNSGRDIDLPALEVINIYAYNTTPVTRSSSSSDFTISKPGVTQTNELAVDITCDVGFRLYHNSTPVSDVMGITPAVTYRSRYTSPAWNSGTSLTFGSGLGNGTYRLVPVHRISGATADFVPDVFSDRNYIDVVISGNTMTLTAKQNETELVETAFDYDYDGVKYHVNFPLREAYAVGLASSSPAVNVNFKSFSMSGSEVFNALGKASATELTVGDETVTPSSFYQFTIKRVVGDFSGTRIESVEMDNTVTGFDQSTSFSHCDRLKSVQLSDAITDIYDFCFYGCAKLRSIHLPNSLTRIGMSAFSECESIESVSIPDHVKVIGDNAFGYCLSLSEVSITPQSELESIGEEAFSDCVFQTITLPASLKSIGMSAFWVKAASFEVHSLIQSPFETDAFGWDEGNVLYVPAGTKSKYENTRGWGSIFNSIIEEEGLGPEPSKNIVFADAEVKRICVSKWDTDGDGELSEDEAAAVEDLGTAFSIPNKIVIIGYTYPYIESFNELQYFTGLTTIGGAAFRNQNKLTSVIIPNSVTSIGSEAFRRCSRLTSVTIGNSVESIGNSAFEGCTDLTSITIPNSVTSISMRPASITLQGGAFENCTGLTSIVVEKGNTVFDSREGCNAIIITKNNLLMIGCKTSTIPNSVTGIGDRAFWGCTGLTSVIIPNLVTNIGSRAFGGCTGLTSVTIPNSVTDIGSRAFENCHNLTSVYISDLVAWCNISFKDMEPSSNPLFYAKHLYLKGKEINDLVIPNSVTSISPMTFHHFSGLTSVTIPNSVTYIGYGAFQECTGLASIIVKEGNATYDSRDNCNAIIISKRNYLEVGCKNTIIPNSVTIIGDDAFEGCAGLTSITIPNSVTDIRSRAFKGCIGLTSITIPNSVTDIRSRAFYRCSSLAEVYSLIKEPFAINDDVFSISEDVVMIFTTAALYVPKDTKAKYEATDGWKKFSTIVEMGESSGDLNGDSQVDVGDIMAIINIMAKGSLTAADIAKADLNGDGQVDVGDIMAVINIMAKQ